MSREQRTQNSEKQMRTTSDATLTAKRVIGGGMKSKRFNIKSAYPGLASKAEAAQRTQKTEHRKQKGKPKTYKGKSMKPGRGGQFAKMRDAIMAKQGRKKYGAKKMAAWSAAGRKRAARK